MLSVLSGPKFCRVGMGWEDCSMEGEDLHVTSLHPMMQFLVEFNAFIFIFNNMEFSKYRIFPNKSALPNSSSPPPEKPLNQDNIMNISMGECNTILSAYTIYRHLG